MSELRFEWDPRKNASNIRKHGVSSEEPASVSTDECALLIDDPDHSADEDRFVLVGLSALSRTLVVCHCYRHGADVIRLISCRRANWKEREIHERRWQR